MAEKKSVPFAERRIAVLGAALIAAMLGAALVWAVIRFLPELPVREVTFTGVEKNVAAETLTRVAGGIRGSLVRTDLLEVKANVEAVEWVRRADIRRRFPAAIAVNIEEHVAAARWRDVDADRDADSGALVNTFGEVFVAEASDEVMPSLPLLVGTPAMSREILAKYTDLKTKLASIQRRPVEVKLSPRGAWSVKLDNGTRLELGRSDEELRLDRFLAAYAQVAELQAAGAQVDLRYPAGLALRKGVPGTAPDTAKQADKS